MRPRWIPILLMLIVSGACAPAADTSPRPGATGTAVGPTVTVAVPTQMVPPAPVCYYVWTSQDLPELSRELDRQLRANDPAVTGSAYAYGEDCVAPDGSRTFSAMETDFQIEVQVDRVTDKERMGKALESAMTVIRGLPASQLQGPRPGRAEFSFLASGADPIRLDVDIASYADKAAGLQGAQLFDALQSGP